MLTLSSIRPVYQKSCDMQMPESNLNIKTQIWHLLKVICGIDTGFI